MKLTVLNVAYPLAPVGPDAVGGAEQVLTAIDEALGKSGHRSIVIAGRDSVVSGELISLPDFTGVYDADAMRRARRHCGIAIQEALSRWSIDLVHLHGVDFHAYLPPPGVPVLATLHLPVSWYPSEIFRYERPSTFLHCVSETQNRDCPPCGYLLPPIRNGVEIPFAKRPMEGDYALAIGRICPEKGFHLAIEACTLAGIPLKLAGKVFPYEAHEKYFRDEVLPRLGNRHVYAGPVGREAKFGLYANARCLIVASTAPETSSLVALEALACGTPVIAFRNGALPEIITEGKTGFLVDTVEEMARAIARASEIDPEKCRQAVRTRFSIASMTERYLELYRSCCAASRRLAQ